MIQDLVASRERTHAERGTKLTGVPLSPGAPHLFDRAPDCELLNDKDAKTFDTDVTTALYLANRTKPTITQGSDRAGLILRQAAQRRPGT